jgi:hypothetical protein
MKLFKTPAMQLQAAAVELQRRCSVQLQPLQKSDEWGTQVM